MVNINLKLHDVHLLALFLGVQGIEDTREIIEKYNLNMDEYEMEDILQNLFEQLSYEIELEL